MDFNDYQSLATTTAVFSHGATEEERDTFGLAYTALGLNGEAGEVAELIKKMIRDEKGVLSDDRREKLKKELGDVLWYLSQCARIAGLSFNEIAEGNIAKLASRANRGKLQGDGSER